MTCVLASVGVLKPVSLSQNQVMPESVCFDEFLKSKGETFVSPNL